jgi:hypothetical protein
MTKLKRTNFLTNQSEKKNSTDYTRKYCSHCKTKTHNRTRCYFINDIKLETEKQNNEKTGNIKINKIGTKNNGPEDDEKELDKQYLRLKLEEENRQYEKRPSGNPEIYSIEQDEKVFI